MSLFITITKLCVCVCVFLFGLSVCLTVPLLYWCPGAASTTYCKMDILKTTGIYFLRVLKAQSLKARCWEDHVPLKDLGKNPPLGLPVSAGSRLSFTHSGITPISASCSRDHLCVCSPFLIKSPAIGFEAHPNAL